jgi:hypothetical protein
MTAPVGVLDVDGRDDRNLLRVIYEPLRHAFVGEVEVDRVAPSARAGQDRPFGRSTDQNQLTTWEWVGELRPGHYSLQACDPWVATQWRPAPCVDDQR